MYEDSEDECRTRNVWSAAIVVRYIGLIDDTFLAYFFFYHYYYFYFFYFHILYLVLNTNEMKSRQRTDCLVIVK